MVNARTITGGVRPFQRLGALTCTSWGAGIARYVARHCPCASLANANCTTEEPSAPQAKLNRPRAPTLALALAVFAVLCLPGAGMDTITSFSPAKASSVKFKGKPEFNKMKPAFRVPGARKQKVVRASIFHLRRMARRPENATVMEEGCNALWHICLNANDQDSLGRHKGACAAVVVALKTHMDNQAVVLSALKLACNLCYAQARSLIGFGGWAHTHSQGELGGKQRGIPDIVRAMQTHASSAEVQDAGIRALANLVYNHTENVLRTP